MSRRAVWEGGIVLGVGLVFAALGAECLAAFNACFADPACYPSSSAMPFGEFFGILSLGVILSLAGAVQLAVGIRRETAPAAR
jgi:hypothetical protein